APIILTTFVQFMNSFYAGKPSCARRMRALCRSVILLDEVQAMQLKLVNLFNEAINFLVDICGCTVLLCTATMPPLSQVGAHSLRLSENSSIVSFTEEEYDSVFKRARAVYKPENS